MIFHNSGHWLAASSVKFPNNSIIAFLLGTTALMSNMPLSYAGCVPGRTVNCETLVSNTSVYDVGSSGTIVTTPGLQISAQNGDAVTINGDGTLIYSDDNKTSLTSINGTALFGRLNENLANTDGYLLVETGGDIIGGVHGINTHNYGKNSTTIKVQGRVNGNMNGIMAGNGKGVRTQTTILGGSDIIIETGVGAVTGGDDGILSNNYGAGETNITTGASVEGKNKSGIGVINGTTSTNVTINTKGRITGGEHGFLINNYGTGSTSITAWGEVRGNAGIGVAVENGKNATDLTIRTLDSVIGGQNGLLTYNYGTGSTTIKTGGAITAARNGILAVNEDTAKNMSIVTADKVTSDTNGILVTNNGTGVTSIDTYEDITAGKMAIHATNGVNSIDLSIVSNRNIFGGTDGIMAYNRGNGSTSINVGGDVQVGTIGLFAENYSTATDLKIVSIGKIFGGTDGILAYNRGTGSTSIIADADITASKLGIYVESESATTDLSIHSGGIISGVTDGIMAYNRGTGSTSIVADGDITASGMGLYVETGSNATDLAINTAGKVDSGTDGITAYNQGTGSTSIVADRDVLAKEQGIYGFNTATATDLTIVSNEAANGTSGIIAINEGSGVTKVNANSDVNGVENAGVLVKVKTSANDLIVDARNGRVFGKELGFDISNTGKGTTTITNQSIVEGGQAGISVNSIDGNKIDLLNKGTITNTSTKWDDFAIQSSDGSVSITNDGIVTGRVTSGSFDDTLSNHGLWQTTDINDFGDGNDTVINEKLVITAHTTNSETTTFSGLETFVNRGVLKLTDSVAGDRTIISGNYVGESGSIVEIDTELGDDNSLTDQLVIEGSSSGNSNLLVNSLLGNGQPTVEGIKVIDVKGTSAAVFSLSENSPNSYLHDGQRAMVSGAFAYKLYKDAASFSDGDWYLRSQLETPPPLGDDPDPEPPVVDPLPPVVDPLPPVVDPQPPVVDPQPPVVDPLPPVVDPLPPVVDPQPPVVDPQPPVVDPLPPVVDPLPPVVDPQPPVVDPEPPVVDPQTPLYQAGAPIYETYGQHLQALNSISTLKQRVGNRHWADGKGEREDKANSRIDAQAIWARTEGSHARVSPKTSTTSANYDSDIWRIQSGVDGVLHEGDAGILFGGITAHYGTVSTNISSAHGNGDIDTTGYGVGANLTWYGSNGFYIDSQAQATWYDSDLNSDTANRNLVRNNDGFGYALSIEAGKRIEIDQQWRITPQAQLVYSNVEFDSFTDPFGARVKLENGDSLKGRIGVAAEYENSWLDESGKAVHTNVYGIANLYYEFLEGIRTDVAGTRFTSQNERLTGGLGLGGDYTWQDGKYAVYGEVSVITSLAHFGDSYSLNGTTGFKIRW